VVDENSAVLGLPHEKRWPMFADHRDLCRFSDADSHDYRTVVSAINEMIGSISPSKGDSESGRCR
jgi:hypothetical protein